MRHQLCRREAIYELLQNYIYNETRHDMHAMQGSPDIAIKERSPLWWVPTGYFTMAITYVMLTNVLSLMFRDLDMGNGKATAYASSLGLAYTIKPLFAPIVEMYRTKKFFVLCAQVAIALGFTGIAILVGMPGTMALILAGFWIISFLGATQDIGSDGVYVTSLDSKKQSLFCGVQSLFWNLGQLVAKGGIVWLSGWLYTAHVFGPALVDAWRVIFYIIAGVTLLMAFWHMHVMPDGARANNAPTSLKQAWLILADAFVTFFQKQNVWQMIAFAFLFRLSIGFLDLIGQFFMVDPVAKGGLGLSREMLGLVYGTYGVIAVLVGSLLGGFFVARRGLKSTLFILCCAVNIPNITFLLMSIFLPSSLLLISLGVIVEKFFFGFGSVGFMIYLMQQLAPGKYQTAHYAFGTGLMGLCMMTTGFVSGHIQETLGYVNYFIFVMIATIPSFLVTWFAPFHHKD